MSKLTWIGEKIGTAIGSLVGIGIVGFFVLIGLKGCIVTVWTPPEEPKTYEIQGADGRFMRMVFLPDRTAINVYGDPNNNEHEAVLYKLNWGVVGKHYFWRVWNVSREGDSLLGFRLAPKGAEPARFEYEILQKWRMGHGDSSFPPVGKSIETVFWFKDGAMRFADMWLGETETDQEFVDLMLQLLKKEKQQGGDPPEKRDNSQKTSTSEDPSIPVFPGALQFAGCVLQGPRAPGASGNGRCNHSPSDA